MDPQFIKVYFYLQQSLLFKVSDELLHISFSINGNEIKMKILSVVIDEFFFSDFSNEINIHLPDYYIVINYQSVTIEEFSLSKFERYDHLLFSRMDPNEFDTL